jgi:chloride channel 7
LPLHQQPTKPNGNPTEIQPPQDDAIRNLFSSKTKAEYSVPTLVTFTVTFFSLSLISYGLALPTGLFVPGILCGAAYGRLVGVFVADMHPRQTVDEVRRDMGHQTC